MDCPVRQHPHHPANQQEQIQAFQREWLRIPRDLIIRLTCPLRWGYFLRVVRQGGQSGQVRSECLMCTFRASWCSARLPRAQIPAFAGSSIRERKKKGGGGSE